MVLHLQTISNMAKIAVIQSVYKNDKPEYLRLSINSILNQTYSDFILYLGVDGPIGEELSNVIDILQTDDRVVIIANKENKGLAHMLNDLLIECLKHDHEFIARMDSDDIACLDRFEKQMAYMESHPDVEVLGSAVNEIDENGNNRNHVVKYPCDSDGCRKFFSKRNPLAHPTVLFRRKFFDNIGMLYPTNFVRNEDTELWLQGFLHDAVVANLPDVLLNFRVTEDMFKQRRNGREFAKSQLALRKLINKELGYGFMASIYAYGMYYIMIAPSWLRKIAYKILR